MNKKRKIFYSLVVIVVIFFVWMGAIGAWPVAFVDKSAITHDEFSQRYNVAFHYYESSLKANNKDVSVLQSADVQKEIKRSVLESLAESKLIDIELNDRISSGDLATLIKDKIGKENLNSENLQKGIEVLYGLSTEQFRDIILVSKAKEEILDGRLILENNNLENWLKDKKSRAKVTVFIPGFYWESGRMMVK